MCSKNVRSIVRTYFENKIEGNLYINDPENIEIRRTYISNLKNLVEVESNDVEVLLRRAYEKKMLNEEELDELLLLNSTETIEGRLRR